MSDFEKPGDLFIGQGVIATGSVSAPGTIAMNGTLTGEIEADRITVGKTGTMMANAAANFIEVSGKVTQRTVANVSLKIESTGAVSGEIFYKDLEVAKGGEMNGSIKQINDAPRFQRPMSDKLTG